MQRDAIRMGPRLKCGRLLHIQAMANDPTVGPATEEIIFAEPGTVQQESLIAEPGG